MASKQKRRATKPAKASPAVDLTGIGQQDPETAITREVTAALLGQAVITLDQQRYRGEGPPFFRPGAGTSIRYRLGDVLQYRDSRTVGKRAS